MRILNVRFKNLNSLLGEWMIDFTDPAYTSDGIFVITGPTGAGKTTILDAVCLALYGRTPRLKDVNQGSNEIMSRQAGECFAEVTFETNVDAKKYCAFWGQHRARKRADGALQQQRHELADADTGTILETKQKDVADKIREVTGLTFEQFSRSVLLAQGDFAAFLQCAPSERSPILEQITGTEIYSRLSVRTHEIRNAEKISLNLLDAEAAVVKGMTPDERQALESQLESLRLEEADTGKRLSAYGAECDWLTNINAMQKELAALDDRRADLTRRQDGFEPERAGLTRAQKALEFGSAHSALVTFRREQDADKHAQMECHSKMTGLEAGVKRSEDDLQLAVSTSLDRQTEQKNLLAVLRKVRELDLKQQEKDAPIAELQGLTEELAATIDAQRRRLEAEQLEFEAAQVQMRDVRKFLQNNASDEKLIERIAGIQTRFEALDSFTAKRRALAEERDAAEKTKKTAQQRLDGQGLLHDTAKTKFTSLENAVKKQAGALGEILGSRSMGEWSGALASLMERRVKLERIEESLKNRLDLWAERQQVKDKKNILDSSVNECLKKIAARQDKILSLDKELGYLAVQAELILRIKDMEEARGRLEDGRPCPLCGSVSHPYAVGNIPQDDEVQLLTRRVREDLKNENEALSALNMESARLTGELVQAESDETRLQSQIQDAERRLTEELAALQLPLPIDADALPAIARERHKTEEQLQKTRLVVERVEKGEEALRALRDDLELARQDRDQLASSRQEAEFEKEAAGREFDRLAREIRLADDELKNIRLDLTRQVIPFGFKNLPEEKPEQVLEALSARLEKWQEHNKSMAELEKRISVWERDLHHERSVLDGFTLELKDKTEALKKLKAEQNALRQQRISLFGEKEPDKEEARQNALAEAAEKQVEAKREARTAAQQELSNMRARIDDLVKSIHARADSLQKMELSFKKQLVGNGFGNEDAYLSACLPEEDRKALQDRASALDMEQVELDALQLDRKFALDELRRRHVSDLTLPEAEEKKTLAAARLKELQQSIGAVSVRLEEDEGLSLKRAGLEERLGKQREEYNRWDKLHELIGSADGQKYRNFVQELTFEMVIRNANRQLQKMMDRYSLVKDENVPLSLNVMDNYQAGKLRSAKNLSGGESFIVSLALALGLSQMASQKVRVDSLFLDEGFGTLDEEALDMALATLTGLKREGKLIGIISHVEALKERIATQIEVIPQGNGVSLIKAPGCVRG